MSEEPTYREGGVVPRRLTEAEYWEIMDWLAANCKSAYLPNSRRYCSSSLQYWYPGISVMFEDPKEAFWFKVRFR